MPYVLTVNSQITCAHNASIQLSSSAKLTVAGAKVLLLPEVVGAAIPACPNPNSSSSKQCTLVASAGGAAAKLTVAGQPVLNDTFVGTSDGAPPAPPAAPPLLLLSPNQTKLSAV
jgi:hypothetical protein